jgi:hypothetical protein
VVKCKNLKRGKCKVTGYKITSKSHLRYCSEFSENCNFRDGKIKLKKGEYKSGFREGDEPIAGMVFVNNLGVRFTCMSDNKVVCPNCRSIMIVLSFQFGVICKYCKRKVH